MAENDLASDFPWVSLQISQLCNCFVFKNIIIGHKIIQNYIKYFYYIKSVIFVTLYKEKNPVILMQKFRKHFAMRNSSRFCWKMDFKLPK